MIFQTSITATVTTILALFCVLNVIQAHHPDHHHHHHRHNLHCEARAVSPRASLKLPHFMGRWYAQKFSFGPLLREFEAEDLDADADAGDLDISLYRPEPSYKCLSVDFSYYKHRRDHLQAKETYIQTQDGKTKLRRSINEVIIPNLEEPAIWTIFTNGTGRHSQERLKTTSVIHATDYHTYSIDYGCSIINLNGSHHKIESATIWTRERNIHKKFESLLDSLVIGLGFQPEHFIPVDQRRCPGDL